jgi:hypothetical protein
MHKNKLGLPGLILCAALTAAPAAFAQTVWFTVLGDQDDASVNTIQVDPTPVLVENEQRTMNVRVSRSALRKSWDGVSYRSYTSRVLFDCVNNTARYSSLTFYMQPGWKGESHKTVNYSSENPRYMEFRDVQPNPTLRIMKAACNTTGKATTS